ncbi:MAG TPA: LuxR C-terminal-related transcriptional regulator [Nocardioidaceae bacterium]|jgi:DNA-binding CsgD family transcriptional regulator|nr:LuxR C-terminal-related transcriptional regulator [Nocardioidaceae bacterium]
MDAIGHPGSDPLVGRDELLSKLDILTNRYTGVLLVGEAGAGKSHLARAYGERLTARDQPVRRTAALAVLQDRALAALRPVIGPRGMPTDDPVGMACDELCRILPDGLLVVDDVDCLDDLSAAALHRVAELPRRREAPKLLFTMRSGRSLPAPLERLLTEGRLAQVPVPPLTDDAAGELVETLLGGPVDPSAARELVRQSRGNPLFVRELVLAGQDENAWVRRTGHWFLRHPVTGRNRLQTLVESRIGALTGTTRRLADTLALLGPVPPVVLLRLGLVDAVADLEAAGLLHIEQAEIGLRHPLFADCLKARAAADEMAETVASMLDIAQEVDLPGRLVTRITALALERNHRVDGPRLLAAARMALGLYDLPLARDLADAACAMVPDSEAAVVSAQAASMLGDPGALARLARLADRGTPDQRQAAVLALGRVQVSGESGSRKALENLPVEGSSAVATLRAVALMRVASWRAATDAALAAVERAEGPGPWLEAAGVLTMLQVYGDDVVGGLRLARRGLAALDDGAVVNPHVRFALAHAAATGAVLDGQPDLAEELATCAAGGGVDQPAFASHVSMRQGVVRLLTGRVASAERHLAAAIRLLAEDDPLDSLCWTYAHLALAQAMRGDTVAATESVTAARAALPTGQATGAWVLARAQAWVHAVHGEVQPASDLLLELADQWSEAPAAQALAAVDLARCGDVQGAAELLHGAGKATGSRVLGAAERAVLGTAAGVEDEVLAGAAELQRHGLNLWAADLLALAARAADECRAGRLRSAAFAASLACGDTCTPALADLDVRLTGTQRRVAELAAQGLSNRQIGEALGMSPRTAATHLYRAYKVLGVNERDQIGSVLGRPAR